MAHSLTSLNFYDTASIRVLPHHFPNETRPFTTYNIIIRDVNGNALEISAFSYDDTPLTHNDLKSLPLPKIPSETT